MRLATPDLPGGSKAAPALKSMRTSSIGKAGLATKNTWAPDQRGRRSGQGNKAQQGAGEIFLHREDSWISDGGR